MNDSIEWSHNGNMPIWIDAKMGNRSIDFNFKWRLFFVAGIQPLHLLPPRLDWMHYSLSHVMTLWPPICQFCFKVLKCHRPHVCIEYWLIQWKIDFYQIFDLTIIRLHSCNDNESIHKKKIHRYTVYWYIQKLEFEALNLRMKQHDVHAIKV